MDYFDKVADGVRSTAETIGKKTQDVVDVSKLKLNAYEINSEIRKRYEALGRIIYDARRSGYNCDLVIDENVRGLDVLYERLGDINIKIAKLKNKVCCPKCSSVNSADAVYCSRCGNRISGSYDD